MNKQTDRFTMLFEKVSFLDFLQEKNKIVNTTSWSCHPLCCFSGKWYDYWRCNTRKKQSTASCSTVPMGFIWLISMWYQYMHQSDPGDIFIQHHFTFCMNHITTTCTFLVCKHFLLTLLQSLFWCHIVCAYITLFLCLMILSEIIKITACWFGDNIFKPAHRTHPMWKGNVLMFNIGFSQNREQAYHKSHTVRSKLKKWNLVTR